MRHALFLLCLMFAATGRSQTPLLKGGQAVVTFDFGCFKGGSAWSMLVYDIRPTYEATPGTATNWEADYLHPMTADSILWQKDSMGSVFGVTIDTLGNIYTAATLIYYLYSNVGTAGSGGIYKIDANTWGVTKFMRTGNYFTYDPTKKLMPNVNTGLGDICYDKRHHQLFVTNFEDGNIYRLDMNGNILSTLDPFGADMGVNGMAPNMERVWAVNVYGTSKADQRLYFSRVVEDGCSANMATDPHNQIWSVGLDPATGNFTGTPVMEIEMPYNIDRVEPTSDICFDASGNMYLAERTMCGLSTSAHESRVLKYTRSSTGTYSGMQIYYTGQITGNDAAGGLDIGRTYQDEDNFICEDKVWATSDAIQFGMPNYIYGFVGMPLSGNSNIPGPNYFDAVNIAVDHDRDLSPGCMPKTSLGDIEIFRTCKSEPLTQEEEEEPEEKDSCDIIKTVSFPNILTANGDLKNDTLKILPLCEEGELMVFDRWGNEVYRQKDKKLNWDGRNKQKQMVSEGVYYCILRNERVNRNWFVHVLK